MNPLRQLWHGVLVAAVAPRWMSGRAWLRAGLYALLALVVLGGVAALFAVEETGLRRLIASFLFPEEVHKAVDFFLEYVVRSQTKQVIANALVTITLIFVSLFLFWAKERLSRQFEKDAGLGDAAQWVDVPMRREVFEEVKLLLLNIALLYVTLWLGHSPEPWRKTTATVFSYLVVFFTWAVDFLSPYLQRRGLKYSQMVVAIFARPFLSFGFGALVSLPLLGLANLASTAEWSPLVTMVVLFGANVLVIIWACVGGTYVASMITDRAARVRPARVGVRVVAWLMLLGTVGTGTWVAAKVASMLRDKSQILKCAYRLVPGTFELGTPSIMGLAQGEITVGGSVILEISNPNALDVELEDNRLVFADGSEPLAETRIAPMKVEAGKTVRQRVGLDLTIKVTLFRKLFEMVAKGALPSLRVTLYVEVADGFEFPVYLVGD